MSKQPQSALTGKLQERRNDVCAVIVTYFPDLEILREVLQSVTPQVNTLVIVDNTPRADAIDLTTVFPSAGQPTWHVLPLGENLGIGAAQNAGIAWTLAYKPEYVLLLDQDSIPGSCMVRHLTEVANNLLAQGISLAAVGPRYIDPLSGRTSYALQIGALSTRRVLCSTESPRQVIRSDVLIASGSMIRTSALKATGLLDDSLFIDHVDHEWCLRARHNGFSCYIVCEAVLMHHLGSNTARYWLGRWRNFPAHSAARHYYMLRNTLLLWHQPHVPFAWLFGELGTLLPILVVALFLLPDRRNRLLLLLRAVFDGIRNRRGVLNA